MDINKKILLEIAERLICIHKGRYTCGVEGEGCKTCVVNKPINVVLDAYNLGKEGK